MRSLVGRASEWPVANRRTAAYYERVGMAGIDGIDVMATQVSSQKLGPQIRVLFPNKTTLLLSWNSHRGGTVAAEMQ